MFQLRLSDLDRHWTVLVIYADCLMTNTILDFGKRSMIIYKFQLSLLPARGLERISYMGNFMVIATMNPATM